MQLTLTSVATTGQANRYHATRKPFNLIGLHFSGPRLPLRKLLTPERVAVPSRARTKDDVLAELVTLAAPSSRAHAELLAAIRSREATFPTALGDGVAMPHVRTPHVTEVQLAACLLDEPVAFGADDGNDVDLLFLVLSPTNEPTAHLTVLRLLSRLVSDADVLFQLRHADDATTFIDVVHAAMLK